MKMVLLFLLLTVAITGQTKTLKLDETNTLSIQKEITFASVPDFILGLDRLNEIKTDKPIFIMINSPGGMVIVSEMLIDFAKHSRRPVHTVAIYAASAAFNMVQSLGDRYVTGYSRLLTHHAYSQFFPLTPTSIKDTQDGMALLNPIYKRSALRLKMTDEEYELLMQKEMLVRGEDNILLNYADKVVDIECSKALLLTGNCPK